MRCYQAAGRLRPNGRSFPRRPATARWGIDKPARLGTIGFGMHNATDSVALCLREYRETGQK